MLRPGHALGLRYGPGARQLCKSSGALDGKEFGNGWLVRRDLNRDWALRKRKQAGRLVELTSILLLAWAGGAWAATGPTEVGWPMFRGGPALLGVAPAQLPPKLNLLWSFKTQGPVKSSPAIAQGRVFVGSDDEHLYALDLRTGRKLWAFKTDGPIESSPLVLEDRVFVGSDDSALYALEVASGKLLWKYLTSDKIVGGPNWAKAPTGSAHWVLVGSYDNKLHCVDAATGKSNWVYETTSYINATPAVSGGVTVVGGCDAILHVVALADGRKLKQVEGGAYIAGSVALQDGLAYFGNMENEVRCVDLQTGTNRWVYRDRPFAFYSSPALALDRLVIGSRDKRVHCLNPANGRAHWAFATRAKVDSSPVICGDKVVVGSDDGRLYLLSLAEGKELWSYDLGDAVSSSPAVAGTRVVVGSQDGAVYCFGTSK
jgi:outer membrane protein assembly factor BamB